MHQPLEATKEKALPNDKRTMLKLHPVKGIEIEAPNSRGLTHYLGVAIVLLAVTPPLYVVLRWW